MISYKKIKTNGLHGGVDNVFDGSSVIKNVTDTGERLIAMPPMPDVVVFGVK